MKNDKSPLPLQSLKETEKWSAMYGTAAHSQPACVSCVHAFSRLSVQTHFTHHYAVKWKIQDIAIKAVMMRMSSSLSLPFVQLVKVFFSFLLLRQNGASIGFTEHKAVDAASSKREQRGHVRAPRWHVNPTKNFPLVCYIFHLFWHTIYLNSIQAMI